MSQQPYCCYIGDDKVVCPKDAEYEINDGRTVDDYTHACADHVGHLLRDGRTSTVYAILADE